MNASNWYWSTLAALRWAACRAAIIAVPIATFLAAVATIISSIPVLANSENGKWVLNGVGFAVGNSISILRAYPLPLLLLLLFTIFLRTILVELPETVLRGHFDKERLRFRKKVEKPEVWRDIGLK